MKSLCFIVGLLSVTWTWSGRLDARTDSFSRNDPGAVGGACPGTGRQQGPKGSTGVGSVRTKKVILVVADLRPLDGMRQALASQLASTGARLIVEKADHLPVTMAARFARVLASRTDPDLLLVAWCEKMDGAGDVLDVLDARHGRILLRRVKDCAGTQGAEEAALIVRTAVDVLLSGGELGVALKESAKIAQRAKARPGAGAGHGSTPASSRGKRHRPVRSMEPPAVDWPPNDQARRPSLVHLAASLAFRLDSLGPALPADPGGGVGFSGRLWKNLSWTVDFWMSAPARRKMTDLSLLFWRYLLETGVTHRWIMGRWRLGVGGTVVGELRQFEMQGGSGVILGPLMRMDGLVGASAKFRACVALTRSVRLFLFAGLQVTIWGPSRYVVSRPDGRKVLVFDWWPLQPVSGLGLEVRLL